MKANVEPPATVSIDANRVASVRRTNLGLILRLLRDHGARSRSQIAVETGLPKATISTLIAELVERGLVREGEIARGRGIGRPGQTVELDGRGLAGLGVEISSNYLKAVALDAQGSTVYQAQQALDIRGLDAEHALDAVAQLIRQGVDELTGRGIQPIKVCLASPGVVDAEHGTVIFAPNIGWRDVAVVKRLRQRLGTSVRELLVENDARLASLAEHAEFGRHNISDLLLLTGETGVAGGVIANGKLLRGYAGLAGEIGHAPLGPADASCPCGRKGCWETVVGLRAMLRHVADDDDPVRDSTRKLEERLAELVQRAEAGDIRTLRGLDAVAAALGHGLSILSDVVNPEVIVLGGYFSFFADYFIPSVQDRLDGRVMVPSLPASKVIRSTLGFDAASYGAARLALDLLFQDPTRVARPQPSLSG
jgi:predicted NBD/HSP70 family sugar kinase